MRMILAIRSYQSHYLLRNRRLLRAVVIGRADAVVPVPCRPRCDDEGMTFPGAVTVRPYAAGDAPRTLQIFLDAVTVTAAEHYSAEQLVAWSAPADRDLGQWDLARTDRGTFVATLADEVAGFSDVDADGYIHMMFVAPRFGRRGVASALLAAVEREAARLGATELWTDASITARPFFERHGFVVEATQHPVMRGVQMTNFRMRQHPLPGAARR
jgi:putative acetyltransferase